MAKKYNSLFDKYSSAAKRRGIEPRSAESIAWFQEKLKTLSGRERNRSKLLVDPALEKNIRHYIYGSMYMYFYDPKHKKTLPYYDRFPLVVAVEPTKKGDGFYGINLHYLPPVLRARMLDALLDTTNNKRYNDTTKMKISYSILKSASKLKYFKPCFKQYLNKHIVGAPSKVSATEWEMAVFLPVEQFKKATSSKVWSESRKMI